MRIVRSAAGSVTLNPIRPMAHTGYCTSVATRMTWLVYALGSDAPCMSSSAPTPSSTIAVDTKPPVFANPVADPMLLMLLPSRAKS